MPWEGQHHTGSTRASRKLHHQVLTEEPTCACGAPSAEAGHIIARALGGPDTRDNLTGQCRTCNLVQLARDRSTGDAATRARTRRPVERHPGLR